VSDLNRPVRPKIIAITNQKGGVGKTTTTINLGAALAELGKKVLVLDLDPQGNASTGLGIDTAERELTTYELLLEKHDLRDFIQNTDIGGLMVIPANNDLSSADMALASSANRSTILRDVLAQEEMSEYEFDYILMDCPPSLNLLTVNALVSADSVLVPLQSEFFALEGLSQLMLTIRDVRSTANKHLRIEGVLLTMFDKRNNLCAQVEDDARENLGDMVFQTKIPRNVRISEAPSFSQSVLDYDGASAGAKAYRALAKEIVENHGTP